jgi:hypothetical protein
LAWSWYYQRAGEVVPKGLLVIISSHTETASRFLVLGRKAAQPSASSTTSKLCPVIVLRPREAMKPPGKLKEHELSQSCSQKIESRPGCITCHEL